MNKRNIERIVDKSAFERNVLIVKKYLETKPETDQERNEFADAYLTFYVLGHRYMESKSKKDKVVYNEMVEFTKEHLPNNKVFYRDPEAMLNNTENNTENDEKGE